MSDLAVFRGRRVVLLDLDGTLYCNEAHRAYVEHVDHVTGDMVRGHFGTEDAETAFERLCEEQRSGGFRSKTDTMESVCGITLASQNRFRERWTRPHDFMGDDPELQRTLDHLASSFTLVLGTNNAPGVTRTILEALGIDADLFAAILTSEDLGGAKPRRVFFTNLLARVGVGADETVSVGDRPKSDLEPAATLGMGTYLVRTIADVYRLQAALPR